MAGRNAAGINVFGRDAVGRNLATRKRSVKGERKKTGINVFGEICLSEK